MKILNFIRNNKTFSFVFVLILLVAAVYGKSLKYDYVYLDDNILILENNDYISDYRNIPELFTTSVFNFSDEDKDYYYRPILMLSFAVDAVIGKKNPFIYHLTNILLHLIAVFLIFLFLKRLKFDENLIFLFTILFAVHPAFVQAVAWIPGRNDTLLSIFAVLSLILLFDYFENDKKQIYKPVLFVISYLIALFTKETAVAMTIIIPLFMFLFCKNIKKKDYLTVLSFVIISVLFYVFMRNYVMAGKNSLNLTDILQSVFHSYNYVFRFIEYSLVPSNIYLVGDFNIRLTPQTLFSCIVFFVPVIASLFFNIGRKQIILFGALWFIIFLLPTLAIKIFIFSHRIYVSYIGIMIMFLEFFTALNVEFQVVKKYTAIILAAFTVMFLFVSSIQVEKFKNRGVFYFNAVEEQPEIAFTRGRLALYYSDIGMYNEAEEQILYAVRFSPREEHIENLGYIYALNNKYDAAREIFEKALQKNLLSGNFLRNLYTIYSISGNKKEVWELIEYFKGAYPLILNNAGAEENIK